MHIFIFPQCFRTVSLKMPEWADYYRTGHTTVPPFHFSWVLSLWALGDPPPGKERLTHRIA